MDARGLEEADWPVRVCERVEVGEAGGWWLEGWSFSYCSAWWREVRPNDRIGRHAGHSTLTTHPWGGGGRRGVKWGWTTRKREKERQIAPGGYYLICDAVESSFTHHRPAGGSVS